MKKSAVKKSLFLNLTSLLLCVALLIGTTFAWFTDTASSGVNKIIAGNLDIEVSSKVGDDWVPIQESTSLFSSNLWEPGHTEYVTLKIENKGTLAFNYKVMVQPVIETAGTNVNGDAFRLSDYLVFKTTKPTTSDSTPADRNAARALAGTEMKLNQAALTQTGYILRGGDAQYITLVIYMPETVGNEANYKTGTTPPKIELGIIVFASQRTAESDSFGNEYDAIATFPDNWIQLADTSWYNDTDTTFTLTTAYQLAGLAKLTNNGNNFSGKTIILGADIDLKGREWTPVGTSNDYAGDWKDSIYFAGSFNGNGNTIKNLKVTGGEGENNIGLFGLIKVAEGVEIKNVVIDGATIKGSGQSTGALAGAMTSGAKWQSGVGLVPDACKNITVKNAVVEGGKYTGGVIGYAQTNFHTITVENTKVSSIKNNLLAEDSGENAGLVCGNLYDLFNAKNITIKNGEVFGFAKVGGGAAFVHVSETAL